MGVSSILLHQKTLVMISKINVFSTFPSAPRNQNLDIPSGSPWWWKAALSSNSHLLTRLDHFRICHDISIQSRNTSWVTWEKPIPKWKNLTKYQKGKANNQKLQKTNTRIKICLQNATKTLPPLFYMLFCMVLHSILHVQWCLLDLFCTLIGLENTSLRWSKWNQEEGRTQKFWYILNRTWHVSSFMVHVHICWKPDLISPCSHQTKVRPPSNGPMLCPAICSALRVSYHAPWDEIINWNKKSKDIAAPWSQVETPVIKDLPN